MTTSSSTDLNLKARLFWLISFSIAMGFLEGSVVVYLRELYYPNGFLFPLTIMSNQLAVVELFREFATIVMLAGIGMLAGRAANERLAFFLLSFAIWDFFYYVFLKLVLDWPSSFMEWDILFLIPVPWVGPVISPVLITLTMVAFAAALIKGQSGFSRVEWSLIVLGCLIVILSWTMEFQTYSQSIGDDLKALQTYIPQHFPWGVFIVGELLLVTAIALYWRRTSSAAIQPNSISRSIQA